MTLLDADAVQAQHSGRTVESRDPGTGEVWRRFAPADSGMVLARVQRARQVQRSWAALPVHERCRVLHRFRAVLVQRQREAADIISRETGKPLPEALVAEVAPSLDHALFAARHAPTLEYSRAFTPSALALWRKRVRVTHQPWGVIGIISPWNYPFMLPAGLALPALATGNAVVLKPSELTPTSAEFLAELLQEAGLPEGVFTVLQGDGAVGSALIDSGVDKVFFTGSVATGRKVGSQCGERLIPCVLELGGSDAAIVLADADVEHAAAGIAWARFTNAGQTCVAPKRIYVEAPAYDAFVAALSRRVVGLRVGAAHDGTCDMGPLIRPSQAESCASQLSDALGRGASIAAQGHAPTGPGWFPPTVVAGTPNGARVLEEETFGPLLPVAAVASADEAIALANSSAFGLSASVWSRNRRRSRDVASRLEAGSVMINDAASVAGIADVPHGGVKMSGTGRSHGLAGLEECVRPRAVVDDLLPRLRQPWWFGYSREMVDDLEGYIRLTHGAALRMRLSGIAGALRLVFKKR